MCQPHARLVGPRRARRSTFNVWQGGALALIAIETRTSSSSSSIEGEGQWTGENELCVALNVDSPHRYLVNGEVSSQLMAKMTAVEAAMRVVEREFSR
jgi:hypothetical protein